MIDAEKRARLDKFTKEFVDKGKLIEAGWMAMRITSVPADASQVQLDEMRDAFFCGAQHLFASIMVVTGGPQHEEPTEEELTRMDKINTELSEFIADLKLRRAAPKGAG